MNWKKMTMTVVVFLLGLSMTQAALAHRRSHGWHGNVGIYIAPPLLGWRYYPPPYYYPPTYYYPPPTYLRIRLPSPRSILNGPRLNRSHHRKQYWYYCTDPEGYYPTVQECPGGWLKVLPQTEQTP